MRVEITQMLELADVKFLKTVINMFKHFQKQRNVVSNQVGKHNRETETTKEPNGNVRAQELNL